MIRQLESRIEGLEMWIYRIIGCILWKQKHSNSEVLESLGMKRELMTEIKNRQIKYFGHIKRQHFYENHTGGEGD